MKKWKKILFPLIVSVLIVGLAACNFGGSGNSQNLEKVRVAEVTRSVFYAPLYVAIEKGFFEDEGLDVRTDNRLGWR